jgi:two-component system CheB/CheR fusion protein
MAEATQSGSSPVIVGVGASAGGLDALQTFLRNVPVGSGLSFIVVFHLDPSFRSLLPEVLAKSSRIPVIEAADGMPVEADRVYTAPGHSFVEIEDGALRVSPAGRPEERQAVIDRFFQSLAKDRGDRAVAVVLSGAGSDGSLGLKAVAQAGGLTMVQDPATAKHDSMPLSASAAAVADHVLPPEHLAEELLAYARHVAAEAGPQGTALLEEVTQALPQVCDILFQATGHNFKHYKTSTLARRTARRMQVLRVHGTAEYLERLRADVAEVDRLFKELLVSVTAFFRDPEAFDALAAEVLRPLLAKRPPGDPVRVWVPGCASGEEAYSIAMLLREQMDALALTPDVQVFATDLDESAIAVARQGSYPLGIADEVSPERLRRFFVKKGQNYHVAKEVRELILFSVHNLINDPPFSRLDLVSCRNLLIYLGSHLQKKLIPLFHYALRPGGYLFLGPSESLTSHRELFRPVDAKSRISQRLPTAIRSAPLLSGRSGPLSVSRPPVPAPSEADTYLVMQRIILDEFAPKAVVVNEEGQLVSASGNLEKYLTLSAGAFHNSVLRMVREGLRVGLRSALAEAATIRRKVVRDGLTLRTEAGVQRVMLTVQPMPQLGEDSGLFLVVFQDVGQPVSPDAPPSVPSTDEAATLIEQLERELTSTRQDLEKTVHDLEAANEELKSTNEELVSMNEELQSANEELETSKEEVQTANDALTRLNSDLENLLSSTQIATLFLDDAGNVRRATAAASAIYNLLPTDSGRPLQHFTHNAHVMPPLPPAPAIHGAEKPLEDEVEMLDGSWFLRRVLPYRTAEGAHEGIVVTFTDVTERKRAEQALLRTNLRLQALMSAVPVGVSFSEDATAAHVTGNPALLAQFAAGPEDNLSATASDLDALGRRIRYRRGGRLVDSHEMPLQRAVAENADVPPTELLVEMPDGRRWWMEASAAPLRDGEGNVIGGVAVTVDITARKQSEEELRRSEERFRQLADAMPQIVWTCGPDGIVDYCNERWYDFTGFERGKPDGASWDPLIHPDDAPRTRDAWQRSVETGEPYEVGYRLCDRSGAYRWHLDRALPARDAEGRIVKWFGTCTDIDDQKRAEDRLREQERELRTIADNTPDMLCRMDREFRQVFVNAAVARTIGMRPEQVLGKTGREIGLRRELCDLWEAAVRRALEERRQQAVELSCESADGSHHYTARMVPEEGPSGEVEHVLAVVTDVTDRKRAEDALAAADQRKDEFLATLAHELRNPLAPIQNGLEILAHARDAEAASKIRQMMSRQLWHMVRLIDDLLDISRISTGKVTLRKERVSLQTACEIAVEATRAAIEASRHTLDLDLPEDPVWVHADVTRLTQIITNLLTNAVKYTPEGGRITLSVRLEGPDAVARVTDTGLGIPKEMLAEVFEMFTQVNRTLNRAQGGLGIGLALVKKLVDMHGGAIAAQSRGSGQGATFTVRLPAAPLESEPPKAPDPPAPAPAPSERLQILVVDDNEDAAQSLAMLLDFEGHDARAVHTGEAALAAAKEHPPHLVFLDIGLPGMDGYEVARRLRSEPSLRATKIVALTGWGSEDDKRKTRAAGFDDHLTKPIGLPELEALLARLDGSRPKEPAGG